MESSKLQKELICKTHDYKKMHFIFKTRVVLDYWQLKKHIKIEVQITPLSFHHLILLFAFVLFKCLIKNQGEESPDRLLLLYAKGMTAYTTPTVPELWFLRIIWKVFYIYFFFS